MRKIKGYTSYSFNWGRRRKPWWQSWWLWLGLLLPLLLISAELLVRGGVWLLHGESWLKPQLPSTIATMYGLGDRGLQVQAHQTLGYTLRPNQSSQFWQINPQGWRASAPVSHEPDPQTTRIFLLGNSTAFGYGLESNEQMLSQAIAKILNDKVAKQRQELARPAREFDQFDSPPPSLFTIKDTNFQVITVAVPGYASGNNLSLLAYQLMAFRPAGLIILEGYEDLRLPSEQTIATLDPLPQSPLAKWWEGLYLVQLSRRLLGIELPPPPPTPYQTFTAEQFSADPQEVQARIDRLFYHWQQIGHIAKQANIPTLWVWQPEITGKQNRLTPTEITIWNELGSAYPDRLALAYQILANRLPQANLPLLNLSRLYQNYEETAFLDPIHLTIPAQNFLAQTIADQVAQLFPHARRKSG